MAEIGDRILVQMEATLNKFERQMDGGRKAAAGFANDTERRFAEMSRRTAGSAERSAKVLLAALDRAGAGYRSVVASVDPLAAAAQRLAAQEEALAEALKRGTIDAAEHARVLALVRSEYRSAAAAMNPAVLALQKQATEAARASQGYGSLIASLDPAAAAAQRLAAQEMTLSRALDAGTIDATEHARAMRLVKTQYDSTMGSLVPATAQATKGMRSFFNVSGAGRFVLQNTAANLGDVAVQLQMGTSPSRVMSQQLPQLLGGFGALGGVLGVVGPLLGLIAAVGIPVAAVLFGLGKNSEDAAEKVNTFEEKLSAAKSALADADQAMKTAAQGGAADLKKVYGEVTGAVLEVIDALDKIGRAGAQKSVGALAEGLFPQLGGISTEQLRLAAVGVAALDAKVAELLDAAKGDPFALDLPAAFATKEALDQVDLIADKLKLTQDQVRPLIGLFIEMRDALSVKDYEAAEAALARMQAAASQVKLVPGDEFFNQIVQVRAKLLELIALGKQTNTTRVLDEYAKTTETLKKLTDDLITAEAALTAARAEGNQALTAQAREAADAIRGQIADTLDSTSKLEDMLDTLTEMQAAMDVTDFDGEAELRKQVDGFKSAIELALQNVDRLNEADLSALEGGFRSIVNLANGFLASIGLSTDKLKGFRADAASFEAAFVARAASGAGSRDEELVRAVTALAEQMKLSAKDLLTVMSFESGGTFDPGITNATGHTGLIQFSPANLQRFGLSAQSSVTDQVIAAGRYLEDAGIKAGDSLLRIYAAILTGNPNNITASDTANGGTPGGALIKVTEQMGPHAARAEGLLAAHGGTVQEVTESGRQAQSDLAAALKQEIADREKLLAVRINLRATAMQQVADQEFENTLIGKSAAVQAMLRAELLLTNQAKRDGIDLSEKVAGTEKTYAQVIRETAVAIGASVAEEERLNAAREQSAQKTEFMMQIQTDLKSALLDGIEAGDGFVDALENVVRALARAAAQALLFNEGPLSGGGAGQGLLGGILGALTGLLGGAVKSADGNVVSRGRVIPFASGGIVDRPTLFSLAGGRTGLMGEAGPEAIFPLARVGGRLGIRAERGAPAARQRPVQVTVNIATPDIEGFRRSRAQIAGDMQRALAAGSRVR